MDLVRGLARPGGMFGSLKEYEIEPTPRGLIVRLDGIDLISSSVIDRSYFPKKEFKDYELELITEFERFVQETYRKLGSRKYSGMPWWYHIDSDVRTSFEIANSEFKLPGGEVYLPKTKVNLEDVLVLLGHDYIEDDEEIRGKIHEWEESTKAGDHNQRQRFDAELRVMRRNKASTTYDFLSQVVKRIVGSYGLRIGEIEKLENIVERVPKLIHDLTRFSNENAYPVSMQYVYSRQFLDKEGTQAEPLISTLKRINAKSPDRCSNNEEQGPIYPVDIMEQLGLAWSDTSKYGDYIPIDVLSRLGTVRLSSKEMSPAVKVATAFNNFWCCQFGNSTMNLYRNEIFSSGEDHVMALNTYRKGRKLLIKSSLALLSSAIKQYESERFIHKHIQAAVESDIEQDKKSDYFFQVTSDGIIKDFVLYDTGGMGYLERLDKDKPTRAKIYDAAKRLAVEMPLFENCYQEGQNVSFGSPFLFNDDVYDPSKKHIFFTVSGVDKEIEKLRKDYWRLFARNRRGF